MISIKLLYLISAILGIISGIGTIDSEINKITSGISLFGMGTVVALIAFRYSAWNILGTIVVSIVFAYISFMICSKKK